MLKLVFCVVLISNLVQVQGFNISRPMGKWLTKNRDSKFECGYVSKCSEGYIVLQPKGGIPQHVRCNWLVAVPEAVSYELQILSADFMGRKKSEGAGLTITAVSYDDVDVDEYYFQDTYEPLAINAQTFVVSFFTTKDYIGGGQGFTMTYKTTATGNSNELLPISLNSEHVALTERNPFHRHPSKTTITPDNYDGRELSIFTVSPKNNLVFPQVRMNLQYTRLVPTDLENDCKLTQLEYFTFKIAQDGTGYYKAERVFCEKITNQGMDIDDLGFLRVTSLRKARDPQRAFSLSYELHKSN